MNRGRLKRIFHLDRFGKRLEESLDEEVAFHLETRIGQLVEKGRTPEEARKEALRQFGDPELVVQRCRRVDQEGARRRAFRELFSNVIQDVRFTFRALRKSYGFAVVAIISLAVGIGVNASLFTVIHATWVAPVPGVTGQDRIVDMVPVIEGHDYFWWAYPDFENVKAADTPFEYLTAWAERDATFGNEEGRGRARVAYATSEYFHVLGALPALGRGFLDSEDGGPGQHPVVVVSHDFWQDQLGGRPDILGQSLPLDGIPYTVVGVAQEEFSGARVNMSSIEMWVPLFQHPDAVGEESRFRDRGQTSVQVLGRLRPGATLPEGRAAVQTVYASLATEYPETNRNRSVKAVGFGRFPAQNRIGDMVAVVGTCGLLAVLLLIICGNLAGMALARAAAKEQEIGVRMALGSSRIRLVRHLMVEAILLTIAGAGVGIALAMTAMVTVSPADLGFIAPGVTFGPNLWTVAVSSVAALAAALAFGLLPALRFSRPEIVSALKDDSGGGGRRVGRIQRIAASTQTGTAFLLLLLGALFLRSLSQTEGGQIGFSPENMVVTDFGIAGQSLGYLDLEEEGYSSLAGDGASLLDRLAESMGSIPGVSAVALADGFPLDGIRRYGSAISADQPNVREGRVVVESTSATEGFFTSIGTPLLQGRGFLRTDDESSTPVAVVTQSLAERLWPGEDPLGRQFLWPAGAEDPTAWTIIGVVGHVASSRADENFLQLFLPLRQRNTTELVVLLRTSSDPSALAGPVRDAIRSVDSGLPPPRLLTGRTLVDWATQGQRANGRIAGGLGLLVLLLSTMGVYGVVALTVANRTREIGLRMAMGATRGIVIRSVLLDAFRLAVPGLVVGGLIAVGLAITMRSMFLGLNPVDPVSFLTAGGVMLLMVLGAGLSPALRASGIHPIKALKPD